MRDRFAPWIAIAIVPACLASASASAQSEAVGARPAPPAPSRVVGFGTAFGGGGAAATTTGVSASSVVSAGPAVELPTLEGLFFIDDHLSIDVSIPLWNMVVLGAFARVPVVAATLYVDFSVGEDWVRFVGGPGVGFAYAQVGSIGVGEVRAAGLLGIELLSASRLFGFRVMTRPFASVAFANGATAAGGGAMLELELISYATNG